jgi:hypothetical protein
MAANNHSQANVSATTKKEDQPIGTGAKIAGRKG